MTRLNQIYLSLSICVHPCPSGALFTVTNCLDQTRLTYRYAGRDFHLTDVDGRVVEGLLA